jgi:gliding motility-associated-like protein
MKHKIIILILLFFNSILFSQTPIASFPFNGNANDVSGNGNNGILGGQTANPTLTADRFGNVNSAYLFGGYYNKNWIQIPNSTSLSFGNQMSVSLWFKQCTFAGMDGWGNYSANGYHILFSKAGDGIAANPGIYSGIYTSTNNLLYINIGNTNGYNQTHNFDASTTMNCFDTCEWIHFVVVVNDTNLKMYFNGQLSLQQTINPAIFSNANTQDFFIGRMNGSGTIWYPFNGIIDDVNIYNVAINQLKVNSLFANYINPLAVNNVITLDSLKVINLACGSTNTGSIGIYPNSNNAPYQFSIDGGTTYQTSGIFPNLSGGTYNVKIKTICNVKDTVIHIIASGSYNTNNSISICNGQSYLGHTTTGLYHDTLISVNGCDSIITTNLTVNSNIQINISTTSNSICKGESITITANGASTYLWSNGLGTSSSITQSPIVTTTYIVNGILLGCNGKDSITITVNPIPNVVITPANPSICKGDTITLTASSNPANTSFLWNNSSTNTTINVSPIINTNYFVIGNLNTCKDTAYATVTVKPLPIIAIQGDSPICEGDSTFIWVGSNMFSTTYLWNNGSIQNFIKVSPQSSTYYFVEGTADNCHDTAGITIAIIPKQIINLGNDRFICAGDEVNLTANNLTGSYLWSNGSNSSSIMLTEPGVYWLRVDINGCISSDTIEMKKCSEIWVPNVFTPNEDGNNDVFISVTTEIQKLQMMIYNRWGEQIFETKDINMGWDGKLHGNEVPSGVYFWVIRYTENRSSAQDIQKEIKGSVTLLR